MHMPFQYDGNLMVWAYNSISDVVVNSAVMPSKPGNAVVADASTAPGSHCHGI